ncbi:MAG TPA: ClpXP protease specificity-enhancing factor SspB [Vicinamibacteria bacterium]
MSTPDDEGFDYAVLVRGALVGMVRALLTRAAATGLPGDHHFYLTFGTLEPGVEMSPQLRRQHREEMTIVLQHQFWNLVVDDEHFAVTLRFAGKPERLIVPWLALRAFADPSASFGLRLNGGAPEEGEAVARAAAEPAPAAGSAGAKVVDFGAYRRRDESSD